MKTNKNPHADIHRLHTVLFLLSLTISLLLVILAFEWTSPEIKTANALRLTQSIAEERVDIPPTELLPPPPRLQPVKIIVVEEEDAPEELNLVVDIETLYENTPEEIITHQELPEEETPTDEIFFVVETPPTFPGGETAWVKFIRSNLTYPAKARRMGVEGKVFVKCVIERDGTVSHTEVIKGVGAGCDEEALRVIRLSPPWIPGKQRGKPVRVIYTFPVTFKLGV